MWIADPVGLVKFVGHLFAVNVPDKGTRPSRAPKRLQDVRVNAELDGIMDFWLTVLVVRSSILTSTRLNIARNISTVLVAEEIGIAEQITGAYTGAVD